MSLTDKKRTTIDARIQHLTKMKVDANPRRMKVLKQRIEKLTEKLSS